MKTFLASIFLLFLMALPASASAGVNATVGTARVTKEVRRSGDGGFARHIQVQPGDMVEFRITVYCSAPGTITVRDEFDSASMSYMTGSLQVNGQASQPGLSGPGLQFSCGTNNTYVIIYVAQISSYPTTGMVATVTVTGNGGQIASDTAQLDVLANNPNYNYNNSYYNDYPYSNGYATTYPYNTDNSYVQHGSVPNPEYSSAGYRSTTTPYTSYTSAGTYRPVAQNGINYFVAPQTGASVWAGLWFALGLTALFALWRSRKRLKALFVS